MPSLVAEQVETEYKNETFEALILYSLFNSLVFPEIKLRETKEINKSIESFTFKHLRNSKNEWPINFFQSWSPIDLVPKQQEQ